MAQPDYRVVVTLRDDQPPEYTISDVYATGSITSHAAEPAYPIGLSAEELREDFDLMQLAFERPVVTVDLRVKKTVGAESG
jgi:hypothetical protein